MKESLTRHQDILPYHLTKETLIHVVGAGAIGSFTILSLAKMGFENIVVHDFDNVDTVNIGNQLYGPAHVGKPKVEALRHIVNALTGVAIIPMNTKVTDFSTLGGIVILAVDNMATRKQMYDVYVKTRYAKLVIDPRMGAENILLFKYDNSNVDAYGKTLYSDDEATHESCTAKSTVYTAGLISGLICKMVKDYVTGYAGNMKSVMWNVKDNGVLINKEEGV